MEQKSHILITQKYLDLCVINGIFGVTDRQINYLSNIEVGNSIFIFETLSGKIVGPFTVTKSLFKNTDKIWETKGGNDPFINRIKFEGTDVYESNDISILWKLIFKRDPSKMFTFNTFQRSNITLFKNEVTLLTELLKQNGNLLQKSKSNKNYIESEYVYFKDTDLTVFSSEARLETYLIKNKNNFINFIERVCKLDLKNLELINQISLPGLNYNIDIILFGDKIVIIELKKGPLDIATIQQLEKYKKYWKNTSENITLIAIGSEFYDGDCKDTFQIKYKITKDKKVKLTSKNGESVDL